MRSAFLSILASMLCILAGPALALPDLVVIDIELIPSSPAPGTGTLRAHFENIGPDDVDLPFTESTNFTIRLNGSPCDSGIIVDLEAGEATTSDTTSCNPLAAGSHTISVTIDSDSEVDEENEANNTRVEILDWVSPLPVPTLGWIAVALLSGALGAVARRRLSV